MEEKISKDIYHSTDSLLQEILNEISFSTDVGLSFKFTQTELPLANSSLKIDPDFQYAKKTMVKEVSENVRFRVNILQHN